MTAMFPDSGVPATDAANSIPDNQVQAQADCTKLWYSTSRCQPRFDPKAANAMLSEMIHLINQGEVIYDCNYLDQVQLSVRRIVQRGLPKYVILAQQSPNYYTGCPDPVLTRYNDGLSLVVIPAVTNTGACGVNLCNLGFVPILRNNGTQLSAGDFWAGAPVLISYYAGYFWAVGMGIVRSDIPIVQDLPKVLHADVDAWVNCNTGNDNTGDGTPGNPFRTIIGAWRKLGALYIASPIYAINIRLQVAGDYEWCSINAYGGKVVLWGNAAARAGYRVLSGPLNGGIYSIAADFSSMTAMICNGVTFVMKGFPEGTGVYMVGWNVAVSNVLFIDCDLSLESDSPQTMPIWNKAGTVGYAGTCTLYGGNNRVLSIVRSFGGGFGTANNQPSTFNYRDIRITSGVGYHCANLGSMAFEGATVNITNVTGTRYQVEENSVLQLNGTQAPGSTDGVFMTGGVVVP